VKNYYSSINQKPNQATLGEEKKSLGGAGVFSSFRQPQRSQVSNFKSRSMHFINFLQEFSEATKHLGIPERT